MAAAFLKRCEKVFHICKLMLTKYFNSIEQSVSLGRAVKMIIQSIRTVLAKTRISSILRDLLIEISYSNILQ